MREDDCLQVNGFCFDTYSQRFDRVGLENWGCCKGDWSSVDFGSHFPHYCRFSSGPA